LKIAKANISNKLVDFSVSRSCSQAQHNAFACCCWSRSKLAGLDGKMQTSYTTSKPSQPARLMSLMLLYRWQAGRA
jgi:hypothetical protein